MAESPFLVMRQVSKHYSGVQALDSVDFAIRPGETHALVGANGSGKSTLIGIIAGVTTPDPGAQIVIAGQAVRHYHAIDARQHGIEVIYQDLALFPNLTVAENIALSQLIVTGQRLIRWRAVRELAQRAMARIGVRLPLDALVADLALGDQQLVAICRALTREVRLVIMDEPTTSLTKQEIDALLAVVRDLRARRIATLFVSHKLDEVLSIADRVTVLRDGRTVGLVPGHELDDARLTMLMTGQQLVATHYTAPPAAQQALLAVRQLTKRGQFQAISFTLAPGEIMGITGRLGAGRTELALALFGVSPADSGEILIAGQPVRIRSVQDAIRLGIGYVPENRLLQGLVLPQSVGRNLVLTVLDKLLRRTGLFDKGKLRAQIDTWVERLAIKSPSIDAPVQTLSGGNQQRVVLAKWLATGPRILILDGPTVGIDVAAKGAIHALIRDLARQGLAIIMISDELRELFYHCNRILVMARGRFVAEFDPAQAAEDDIQMCVEATDERVLV
ncbi:MAG: sugar ABC transporter ATP-binding protein [Chloroflexales bacterium]|nr:sugar ABC transporter ATP-binding protein [Chloroflexales bacterium]